MTFDAREALAHELGCNASELTCIRGPFEGYRGTEADYARAGHPIGTVRVGLPAQGFAVAGQRRLAIELGSDLTRSSIPEDAAIIW
jgi:hypothetical protein